MYGQIYVVVIASPVGLKSPKTFANEFHSQLLRIWFPFLARDVFIQLPTTRSANGPLELFHCQLNLRCSQLKWTKSLRFKLIYIRTIMKEDIGTPLANLAVEIIMSLCGEFFIKLRHPSDPFRPVQTKAHR